MKCSLYGAFFLVLFFAVFCVYAEEINPYPFTQAASAERFASLIKEVRCVVCQNQTIADSNAPLANDLREKIYQMVKAEKSTEEIKDYLVKRYGEFILFKPRLNRATLLLWAFPLLSLCIAIIFLFRFINRKGAPDPLRFKQ